MSKLIDKNENQSSLQELILEAMDGRTQKKFAEDCGLSKEHLCRLLDIDNDRKPTKQTLLKIYKAGKGKVTLQELYDSCDYTLDKELDIESDKIDLAVAAKKSVMALDTIVHSLLMEFSCYTSLKVLMATICGQTTKLKDIFVFSDYKILLENKKYKGRYRGTNCVVIEFNRESFLNDIDGRYCFYFVFYYIKTQHDELVLTDYSSNVSALLEQKNLPIKLKLLIEKDNLKNNKYLAILENYSVLELKRLKEKNERLFVDTYGIVNSDEPNTYLEVLHGPGFYVEFIPNKFKDFMEIHKDTFSIVDYEKNAVDKYLKGVPLLEAFSYIRDDTLLNKTYNTSYEYDFKLAVEQEEELICIIITEILNRELKRNYSYYLENKNKDIHNRTCIMETISNKNTKGFNKIKEGIDLLLPYAKELGIEYLENCYFYREELYMPCKVRVD